MVCGDEVIGAVSWRRHLTAPASYCWVLGIGLFPQARGHGYGTQAHRLLVGYLFAHTTVHRIEAATETGNVAEQKALERAGFSREGVARWRVAGRSALQHPPHRSVRVTCSAIPLSAVDCFAESSAAREGSDHLGCVHRAHGQGQRIVTSRRRIDAGAPTELGSPALGQHILAVQKC